MPKPHNYYYVDEYSNYESDDDRYSNNSEKSDKSYYSPCRCDKCHKIKKCEKPRRCKCEKSYKCNCDKCRDKCKKSKQIKCCNKEDKYIVIKIKACK